MPIASLIVVLAVGIAIGAWFVKTTRADDSAARRQTFSDPAPQKSWSSDTANDWNPFRQLERMQEEIFVSSGIPPNNSRTVRARRRSGPMSVTLLHLICATAKITTSYEPTCLMLKHLM